MAKKGKKNRAKRAEKPRTVAGNGKATLIFPPSPGAAEGFTNSSQSSFSPEPSSCVRELVQNALDAALVSAGRERAVVRFALEDCRVADIPGMPEYKTALASAMKSNLNGELAKGIAESLQGHSQQQNATVLFVSDNGIGFDESRLAAMLGDGVSQQSDKGSRGAFGNGHLTAFALSHLRYAFYGGVREDGRMLFSGHAVLSSHSGKYKGRTCALSKDGYYVRDINEEKLDYSRFAFPGGEEIPPFLLPKMEEIKKEWKSGSVIAVIGFNDFGNEVNVEEVIRRQAALNFYVAVHEKKLCVEITHGNERRTLTSDDLRNILEQGKDRRRGRDGFPSGRRVWNSYETLVSGEKHEIETAHGNVRLLLRQGGDGKQVAVCRNGMWITGNVPRMRQADFGDREPFDALLLVDAEVPGNAHTLIKMSENPLHNKIDTTGRNGQMNPANRKNLKALLNELRDKITNLAEKKSEDEYSPSDIMPVEFAAESVRGERPQARGDVGKIGGNGQQQKGGKNKTKKRNARRAKRSGNPVNVRVSTVRENGTLSAVLISEDDCEDVEVRLSLDEGEDATCASHQHETVALSDVFVNNEKVADERCRKDDNGNIVGVLLGGCKSGDHYDVTADYTYPAGKEKCAIVVDVYRRKAGNGAESDTEGKNARN